MILDLVPIWTLILGLAVFYYVVFDGFDLGVGILSGFVRTEWRRLMMNSVAPIWDGNETWLVLGGIGLMAAFPLAFAIIIPAVYFPIIVMLLALVFRGVAFEFRFKQPRLAGLMGHGVLLRLDGGDVCARGGARRLHPGLQGRRPPFRRRLVRFPDAVRDADRHCADVRLRSARRRLAHHEDRGRSAGVEPACRAHLPRRCRRSPSSR